MASPILFQSPELMEEDPKPFKVWFCWGSPEPTTPRCYEFETEELLRAFLQGVDAASGWLEYSQFETQEEAVEWFNSSDDDDEEERDDADTVG